MTKPSDHPSRVFAALGDPTRAQIIDWLYEGGSGTATEFAVRLPISRQAVSRHLKELEEAGLIAGSKQGREMRYQLRPQQLRASAEWPKLEPGAGSGRCSGWPTISTERHSRSRTVKDLDLIVEAIRSRIETGREVLAP